VTLQNVTGETVEGIPALVSAALQQFYEEHDPPGEVDVPVAVDDAEAVEAWLAARAGRKVRLLVPQRGDRRRLVDLASRNAEVAVRAASEPGAEALAALDGLREALALPGLPRRIECIDISTLQGSETVAAVVVCEDGRMARGEYRKYRLRQGPGTGDRGPGKN
jgi:excinuclease ABC subunit C